MCVHFFNTILQLIKIVFFIKQKLTTRLSAVLRISKSDCVYNLGKHRLGIMYIKGFVSNM